MNVCRRIVCARSRCASRAARPGAKPAGSDAVCVCERRRAADVHRLTRAVSVPVYDEVAIIGGNNTVKTDLVANRRAWAWGALLVGARTRSRRARTRRHHRPGPNRSTPIGPARSRARPTRPSTSTDPPPERDLRLNRGRASSSARSRAVDHLGEAGTGEPGGHRRDGTPFTEVSADVTFAESRPRCSGTSGRRRHWSSPAASAPRVSCATPWARPSPRRRRGRDRRGRAPGRRRRTWFF